MDMNKILYKGLLAVLVLVAASCNKELDVTSTRYSSEQNHWKTIQDTRAGLLGIYSLFRTAVASDNLHWIAGELREGDFTAYNRSDLNSIIKGELKSTHGLVQRVANWRRFYAVINAANTFIEKAALVEKADPLYTESNLIMDLAQARALRAFTYFYMVRIWGDVPLITKSFENGKFDFRESTKASTVLDYAEKELLAIASDIPMRYGIKPNTYYGYSEERWQGVLFNELSVYTALAHIAAWQERYLEVERYTGFIMTNYVNLSNSGYSSIGTLVSKDVLTGVFGIPKSKHFIGFGFNTLYGESTQEGHIEDLTLAAPIVSRANPDIFVHKDTIAALFNERGDQRFSQNIFGEAVGAYFTNYTAEAPLFTKIQIFIPSVQDGSFAKYSSSIVFSRLEEIALLRAEAQAALRKDGDALGLLNQRRTARGLPAFLSLDNAGLIQEIFKERRRELMGEGWRWYDLVRFNRLNRANTHFNTLLDQGGIYWPIAEEVLNNNPMIKQNSYWK